MNLGILANIVGSGIGVIVIFVTVLALAHLGHFHLPNAAHPWIYRLMIIVMYGAGSLLAFTGLGVLWSRFAGWVAAFFGGLQGGIPHMVLVIGAIILILGLVLSVTVAPTPAGVMSAALVPAVLMLTSYGFIHSFWLATSGPAQHVASQFGIWLGG